MTDSINPTTDLQIVQTSPADGDVATFNEEAGHAEWRQPEGGGSQPLGSEAVGGNQTSVANGASGALEWAFSFGDELLDLTDPTTPTVVDAGVYLVSVSIQPGTDMTDAGWFSAALTLDSTGDIWPAGVTEDGPAAAAGHTKPSVAVSFCWYIPAGGALNVTVANNDGVQDLDFTIEGGSVVRLTGAAA